MRAASQETVQWIFLTAGQVRCDVGKIAEAKFAIKILSTLQSNPTAGYAIIGESDD
jgi:hypothetical protein